MSRTVAFGFFALAASSCAATPAPVAHPPALPASTGDCPLPLQEVIAFSAQRLAETVAFVKRERPNDWATYYPAVTRSSGAIGAVGAVGEWDLTPRPVPLLNGRATDWRSGYFAGELWLVYALTGDEAMRRDAKAWTAGIEPLADKPFDYDIGCRFSRSFGVGLRVIGERDDHDRAWRAHARDVLVRAAKALDRRLDMDGVPVGAPRSLHD